MKIVWDESKRQANIDKHKLDFAVLNETVSLRTAIRSAKHGRLSAIGKLENGTIAVIFVKLGTQGLSMISMIPANLRKRRHLYEQE